MGGFLGWSELVGFVGEVFLASLPRIFGGAVVFLIFALGGLSAAALVRLLARRVPGGGHLVARVLRAGAIGLGMLMALGIMVPGQYWAAGWMLPLVAATVLLGFQGTIRNAASALILSRSQRLRTGMHIVVGEYGGMVVAIGLVAVKLRLPDGGECLIPNERLLREGWRLPDASGRVRSYAEVCLPSSEDAAYPMATMIDAIRQTRGVQKDPAPRAVIRSLDDGQVVVGLYWWSKGGTEEAEDVRDRVLFNVKCGLQEIGVGLVGRSERLMLNVLENNQAAGSSIDIGKITPANLVFEEDIIA